MLQIKKTTYGRYALKLGDIVLGVWGDERIAEKKKVEFIEEQL